jgi:hypothetical protein
VEELERQWQAR